MTFVMPPKITSVFQELYIGAESCSRGKDSDWMPINTGVWSTGDKAVAGPDVLMRCTKKVFFMFPFSLGTESRPFPGDPDQKQRLDLKFQAKIHEK